MSTARPVLFLRRINKPCLLIDTAYYFGFFKKVQVAQPLHA
jgi:hypothetical protein